MSSLNERSIAGCCTMIHGQVKFALVLGICALALLLVKVSTDYNYKPVIQNLVASSFIENKPVKSMENGDTDVIVHRRVNQVLTEYNENIHSRLKTLVDRKAAVDDPELIQLVRDMMDPPSKHIIKPSRAIVHTPQSKEAKALLNNKKGGFFIEVGGFDGERSSNTIALEHHDKWSGLLIEMDPYFYTQLLGKSRKAWSINACLSPYNYPIEMNYKEASGGVGELHVEGEKLKQSAILRKVPCFPFETILLALNRTHIDFFSLDVEGFELEILKTVDFNKFDITVLTVEYLHGRSGKLAYKEFMNGKGYSVHKDIHHRDMKAWLFVEDYVFVKKSTR